jgi:asparagine synthase (glutamine-hydrolysing)
LERGYFRPEVVRSIVDDHQSGRFDHSYRLWALLVFELWQREWIDQNGQPEAVTTCVGESCPLPVPPTT